MCYKSMKESPRLTSQSPRDNLLLRTRQNYSPELSPGQAGLSPFVMLPLAFNTPCFGSHLKCFLQYVHLFEFLVAVYSLTNFENSVRLNMSGSEFDIATLTESQQLALGTYTSVTNQDPNAAIALLRRSEWNVQVIFWLEYLRRWPMN